MNKNQKRKRQASYQKEWYAARKNDPEFLRQRVETVTEFKARFLKKGICPSCCRRKVKPGRRKCGPCLATNAALKRKKKPC